MFDFQRGSLTLHPPTGIGQSVEVVMTDASSCKTVRLASQSSGAFPHSGYKWVVVHSDVPVDEVGS